MTIPPGVPLHEAGDAVVMPGIVDTHVHINEPGRTEWEGFSTATRAAAAGGVTTLIEMPLNSIPATTTASAFREKLAAAAGKLSVDVGFWGGVVPGNVGRAEAAMGRRRIRIQMLPRPERRRRIRIGKRRRPARGASRIGGAGRAAAGARRAAGPNRRCGCEAAENSIAEALRHVARIAPARSRGRSHRTADSARA